MVRDLARTGAIVDAAVEAGATSINGIGFRLEDPTAVEAQAREAAMTDAKYGASNGARSGLTESPKPGRSTAITR